VGDCSLEFSELDDISGRHIAIPIFEFLRKGERRERDRETETLSSESNSCISRKFSFPNNRRRRVGSGGERKSDIEDEGDGSECEPNPTMRREIGRPEAFTIASIVAVYSASQSAGKKDRQRGFPNHVFDAAISEDEEHRVGMILPLVSVGELDGFVDHF
jgi:hypothetical protein